MLGTESSEEAWTTFVVEIRVVLERMDKEDRSMRGRDAEGWIGSHSKPE